MRKNKQIEITLPIIMLVILIIICSIKIILLITEEVKEIDQVLAKEEEKEMDQVLATEEVKEMDQVLATEEEKEMDQVLATEEVKEKNQVLAKEEVKETNKVCEVEVQEKNNILEDMNKIENNITVENTEKSQDIENTESNIDQKKEEIEVDQKALSQINTTSRKTSSGKRYTSIGLINIPSLNIKYQILSSTSAELLKISVNKYWGPNPNEEGNLCILGHNYKDSRFFGRLPKIKKGAKVLITDLTEKTLTYKVYETDIIKENDVNCTSQKTNGNTEVTLITCYYEPGHKKATKRFIAKARAE